MHSYEHVLAQIQADGSAQLTIAGVYYIDLENGVHAHRSAPWPRSAAELAAPPAEPILNIAAECARSRWPIFSLLHGNEGEDGAWQGLAEIAGLQGNFGPVLASALAMSKFHMAMLASSLQPVRMPHTIFLDARASDADLSRAIDTLGSRPSVVKPNSLGSSLLAERHHSLDLATLRRLRHQILPYDPELLVQEYVTGTEYTAGCLEIEGKVTVLPIVRAVTAAGFLGHREKHKSGLVHPEIVGAGTEIAAQISTVSANLFRAFNFLGMCRFDYIAGDDGNLYFLEANTLPGLTSGSAYTLMLAAGGHGMVDLIRACISAARARPRRTKVFRYHIDH